MILTGKTEVLGERHVTVPLCLPQIPYRLAWDPTCTSAVFTGEFISRLRSREWSLRIEENKSVLRSKWLVQFPAKSLFDLTGFKVIRQESETEIH
jgi:hypothetical protein